MNPLQFTKCLWFAALIVGSIIPLSLYASDTIIGLDFEMNYCSAQDSLIVRGFRPIEPDSLLFEDADGCSQVTLYFAKDKPGLKCIMITLRGEDTQRLENQAIDMLTAFHSSEYEYDAEVREAWWKLDEFHFLNAAALAEDGEYSIFYGDIREEELNPF